MLFVDMIVWWYGAGWIGRLVALQKHLADWMQYFSLGTLLKTLFQPWKQITTQPGTGASFDARKNALVDNLVSRFVGFFVRVSVFFFALVVMLCVLLWSLLYVALWPLIPIAPFVVIMLGVSL